MDERKKLENDLQHYKDLLELKPAAAIRVALEELIAEINKRLADPDLGREPDPE